MTGRSWWMAAAVAALVAGAAPAGAQSKEPASAGAAGAAAAGAASGTGGGETVAIVGGEKIGSEAVDALIRSQLMDLRSREHQLRSQALDALVAQELFEQEAKARGIDTEALYKAEVEDKASVGEAEARAFYQANKERFGTTAEADALRQIQAGLGQQRQNERRSAFAKELRAKYPVKLLLEPYRVPVELGSAPVRGNPSAPVTILEFSDFQCPYCVRARPAVAKVRETYGDKVRFVFRHFPLSFHAQAQKAGEAAACAGEQGKFWEMHDRLWENASKLQVADLKEHAVALGLDATAFNTCLDSNKHAGLVEKDTEAGQAYGVSGTPAFFVNGRPLVGAQPFEAFQQVIDDELQRLAQGGAAAASK